jgi:NAD(P)-dependent dehydrogenase (short-subunit alcohol dehydrogenase family)
MTGAADASDSGRPRDLLGQPVVVIGGSSGIGLETGRLAGASGADVVLAGHDPDDMSDAASQVDAGSRAAGIDGGQQLLSSRGGTR